METLSMSNVSVEAQTAHVAAAVAQMQHHDPHHQQQSPTNNSSNATAMEQQELQDNLVTLSDMHEIEEIQEDIVSIPREVILISLVSQEQALYNPKHEHYRNSQRKDAKWQDIADSVGWSDTQCKAKWKALRDQYCRELKRSKFNSKANVKWKYFKELDFLRPYALSRNYRPRNSVGNTNSNNNISFASSNNSLNDSDKYHSIKIEAGQFSASDFVTATEEQLSVMQQQQQDGNWNYITTTTTIARSGNNDIHSSNHSGSNSNNLQAGTTAADDALYNSFVAQITQQQNVLVTTGQMQQQQHGASQQNAEEEDDDLIHTFLNIESYFEKELITLIQQDDILYNSFHPNYRNVKMKLEVWDEIARKLKKTVKQCRLKWKALRDQYIREHKRLKNRENPESLPRWKHYDALSFLQKFIKHKSNDADNKSLIEIPKTEVDADMDDPGLASPADSPMHEAKCLQPQHLQQLQTLPSLSGPHTVSNNSTQQVQNTLQQQLSLHHQQQLLQQHHQQVHEASEDHEESMCVASADVTGYDEMDITDYIIGDGGGDEGGADDQDEVDDDEVIDRKSQQFPDYSQHGDGAASNDNDVEDELKLHQDFKASHDGSIRQIQTPTSHSLSHQSTPMQQQHLQQQQEHQQQQAHQPHIVDEESEEHKHHQQDFAELLNGNVATTTPPSSGHEAASGTPAAGNSSGASVTDDDEVGAFFKAVAMKIRNAKMSPVAFTDLQIDILRVINGTLRNH